MVRDAAAWTGRIWDKRRFGPGQQIMNGFAARGIVERALDIGMRKDPEFIGQNAEHLIQFGADVLTRTHPIPIKVDKAKFPAGNPAREA